MPQVGVVGREHEFEEVDAFIASLCDGFADLMLEGPAGIGKTTLWLFEGEREAVRRAAEAAGIPFEPILEAERSPWESAGDKSSEREAR